MLWRGGDQDWKCFQLTPITKMTFTTYQCLRAIKFYKSIYTRWAKCAKCQIFGIFGTPNTKKYQILDVPNLIIFATCYSILIYFTWYGHLWHMILLFFYSSFSLIPIISFVFSYSYSLPSTIQMCLLAQFFF